MPLIPSCTVILTVTLRTRPTWCVFMLKNAMQLIVKAVSYTHLATKFLIPLSYVTILGGICTLIGTSTNLVVHGMRLEAGDEERCIRDRNRKRPLLKRHSWMVLSLGSDSNKAPALFSSIRSISMPVSYTHLCWVPTVQARAISSVFSGC